MSATASARPLSGVRVIDFSQVFLGPAATLLLADHGAEVVKVERPGSGELMRAEDRHRPDGAENPMFVSLNRGKRSIAVDLRSEAGREVVLRLLDDADVLIHNFRPGVMTRLGLDYDDLHELYPRLIYGVGSGYGPSGPLAHLPGQDALAQAMSGVMRRTAEADHPLSFSPTAFADYGAGMHLAIGVLLALRARDLTGKGQRVDVSLYNSLLGLQVQEAAVLAMCGEELNWARSPLAGVFETADGAFVLIGAFRANPLRDICRALGIEDLSADPRFATFAAQARHRAQLHTLLADRLASGPTRRWLDRLEEVDILAAPVRSLSEALAEPQTEHNEMLLELEQDGRLVKTVGTPVRLSADPGTTPRPAPALGADTDALLEASGYSVDEIARMRQAGAVA